MKALLHLLKFDILLLGKYKIFAISAIVTTIYVGVFNALSAMGDMEKLLVLIIFNDPALLGFLFAGVLVLFEKNENTLQALSVTPMKISHYLLSKAISLTALSLICCYGMVWAGYGGNFHFLHFTCATVLTTFIFSMLGFIAVAGQSSFNQYILRALGIILVLSMPFLAYFDVVSKVWFLVFPTQPAIDLYNLAFTEHPSVSAGILAYSACIFWALISFFWAKYEMTKHVFR